MVAVHAGGAYPGRMPVPVRRCIAIVVAALLLGTGLTGLHRILAHRYEAMAVAMAPTADLDDHQAESADACAACRMLVAALADAAPAAGRASVMLVGDLAAGPVSGLPVLRQLPAPDICSISPRGPPQS